jgi:tripartite-type tricarboxylate transporter receptor subunit TctC
VDLAKANPETVTVGTPGAGTTSHIAIAALFSENKASMIMVPYRGSPPVADLIGGQVQIGVGLVPSYVGAVNTGQVTGLAVTGRQRSQQLPTVPTAEEAGFPGFEATAWYVLAAPAGTPHEIVQKINTVVNEYLKSEKCRSQFSPMDIQPVGGTPAEAKAFIESEMEKWGPIIRQTNIKM